MEERGRIDSVPSAAHSRRGSEWDGSAGYGSGALAASIADEQKGRFGLSPSDVPTSPDGPLHLPLIPAPATASAQSLSAPAGTPRLRWAARPTFGWGLVTGDSKPWHRPVLDCVLLYLVAALSLPPTVDGVGTHSALLLGYPLLVTAVAAARGLYRRRVWISSLDAAGSALVAAGVAAMVYVTATTLAGVPTAGMPHVLDTILLTSALLCTSAGGLQMLRRWAHRTGRSSRRALIVGAGVVGSDLAVRLRQQPEYGLLPVGMLDADPVAVRSGLTVPMVGRPKDVVQAAEAMDVDHVILAFTRAPDQELVELVRSCDEAGLEVSLVPRLFESLNEHFELRRVGMLPLMALHHVNPKGWQFTVKYGMERALAAVLLILLAPLLTAISLAVKLTSPGPVLFRQRRVGLDGQVFDLLKFRSMRMVEELPAFDLAAGLAPGGVEGADRRTGVGRLLRRTFLDELPQLVNVLRGEMSLIGPRPERPQFVEMFNANVARYDDRHRTKSGITGWAQVHGLRGQTSLADRIEYDNYYIDNWSFALDVKILVMTLVAVFRNDWNS